MAVPVGTLHIGVSSWSVAVHLDGMRQDYTDLEAVGGVASRTAKLCERRHFHSSCSVTY